MPYVGHNVYGARSTDYSATGVPRPVIPWLIALEIVVLALVGAIG